MSIEAHAVEAKVSHVGGAGGGEVDVALEETETTSSQPHSPLVDSIEKELEAAATVNQQECGGTSSSSSSSALAAKFATNAIDSQSEDSIENRRSASLQSSSSINNEVTTSDGDARIGHNGHDDLEQNNLPHHQESSEEVIQEVIRKKRELSGRGLKEII